MTHNSTTNICSCLTLCLSCHHMCSRRSPNSLHSLATYHSLPACTATGGLRRPRALYLLSCCWPTPTLSSPWAVLCIHTLCLGCYCRRLIYLQLDKNCLDGGSPPLNTSGTNFWWVVTDGRLDSTSCLVKVGWRGHTPTLATTAPGHRHRQTRAAPHASSHLLSPACTSATAALTAGLSSSAFLLPCLYLLASSSWLPASTCLSAAPLTLL